MDVNAGLYKSRQNPYESANIISKYLYYWMREVFKIDRNGTFTESDLFRPLKAHECHELSENFEILWNDELKSKSPSLFRILRRRFGTSVLILGFLFSICDSAAK